MHLFRFQLYLLLTFLVGIFVGMGTKVQYKCYVSGYHPIRDLDEDTNFSWSPFSEDKSFSWQLCNDFKPRTISSWSTYDKETLKQTMLEHEATFQTQVY